MADDIVVDVSFRGNATDFLATLSRAVGNAKTQLQEMGQSTAALSRLETQLARMSGQAKQFAQSAGTAATATQGWAQKWVPYKGALMEADAAQKSFAGSLDKMIATGDAGYKRMRQSLADFNTEQANSAFSKSKSAPMEDWDKQFQALGRSADANTAKIKAAQRAIDDYQNSLSNARYVLYDVAGTLTILGAAFIAPLVGVVSVAAEMEKQFAQVARTSGLVGSELQALKSDFDDLYSSIPITYESLAKIATLAGQLGVPGDRIAAFTETVAKTAAVTDLSVEAAATAFGRLDALIPNVKGQYDRLGSSIALVGVKSVATESQIVNISTQISSMGAFAGLTAQDIVGLSGALASVGAQPELSRGTVTRVFTLMSRAVAEGGDSLNKFANLSGVSASKFASSWGTPAFTDVFIKFMSGIQQEGGNAVAALNELGITSVRDVPLLLRLANAADTAGTAGALLATQIGYGNQGWEENVELQRQYEIIAATVAARTEVLVNNFNLLMQAIGGPMLSSLAEFINFLSDTAGWFTDLAKTDLGGAIGRVVVVLSALLGVLAVAGGAMALFGASSIGVYQALQFIAVQSPKTAAMLVGTAGATALADGSMKAGAASALLFGRALKAITLVGALLILPDLIKAAGDAMDDFMGKNQTLKGQMETLGGDLAGPFNGMIRSVGGARNVVTDLINSLSGSGRAFSEIDDALKSLVSAGDSGALVDTLNQIGKASGQSGKEVLQMFGEVKSSAADAGIELKVVGGEIVAVGDKGKTAASGTGDVATQMDVAAEAAESAAGSLQDYKDALDAINGTQMSAADASDRLQSSVNAAWEAIAAGDVTLEGTNDNSIRFRDSLREIESSARTAGEAILENGGSTEEAMAKWQAGRDQIVLMLETMGKTPEEAQGMADAMFGTSEQMLSAFRAITSGLNAVPASKTITLVADTSPAQDAINRFVWANDGRRITFYVDGYEGRKVAGSNLLDVARADGGAVFGPGTSKSDSIIAALSNGEYVLQTAAAQAIGYGRLDYMNRTGKMPAFATGGMAGSSSPAPRSNGGGGITVVELSARDRALLAQAGNVSLSIDGKVIANTANAANFVYAKTGKN